jgi:simple sugar transport system ATP-binding protein
MTNDFILEAHAISKCYGDVLANVNVDFSLRAGEVHCLLGENGAGKSTLVKILYGLVRPDGGEIVLNGEKVDFKNSAMAIDRGIGMVHQELMLIPYLTVAENVMLGREITKGIGQIDRKKAESEIGALSGKYGFDIDTSNAVHKLPIGVQQRVEIIKLLYRKANILILDEPTALLTPQETNTLFEIIRSLKAQGKSIIFITHKLKEVYQITDRMTIMRGGRTVVTTTPQDTDETKLAELMIGKHFQKVEYTARHISNKKVLSVQNISVHGLGKVMQLDRVSFDIHYGEVLGVIGIEGNGQTQLAQALLGLQKVDSGAIIFCDNEITNRPTSEVRLAGVASIPDDRQKEGLVLPFRIKDNLFLNRFRQKPFAMNPLWQNWNEINTAAKKLMDDYDVRAPGIDTPVASLSGGNQQKVVVARELAINCKLLVASQPTRGVDAASAANIQQKILDTANSGTAVLLISSDMDEVIALSDRVMVVFRGKNVGIISANEVDRDLLGRMMLGIEQSTT